MTAPRFTPYDGSSAPFTIGLQQIDPGKWIETDADLGMYLAEKCRLLTEERDNVFQEIEGSRNAQSEALAFLVDHLASHHADTYRRHAGTMAVLDQRVSLESPVAPLVTAGSLIADDLVILEKGDGGWRVTAGYVSFPSSWSLKEKAGKTMGEIHGPVPGFESGSRNDGLINRMFDNIQPDRVVERFNWSIYPDGGLYWPAAKAVMASRRFLAAGSFVRVERQTLRKLPSTGAMLFTIRVYHDPVSAVTGRPDLAQQLSTSLMSLTPEQLAYKGMTDKRDELLGFLRQSI